jgi:CheY-like chemotaxis protein
MRDLDHVFHAGIFNPEEVKLLRKVHAAIASQPWFTSDKQRRTDFALYVLRMYNRGLVVPDRLEAVCRLAAQAHFSITSGSHCADTDLRGLRFLVVEDEALLAKDVFRRLTAQGASVSGPVASVAEALALVGDQLDGALLDISLDGELVYPVATMLRSKKVPFAFVSGFDRPDVPADLRDVPVFAKPVDWATIAGSLVAG